MKVAPTKRSRQLDEIALALLRFPGDVFGELFCGVQAVGELMVRIFGSEGTITVPTPWHPGVDPKILVTRRGERTPREVTVPFDGDLFGNEADTVAAALDRRQAAAMSWDDTLGNMRVLEDWRRALDARA